MRTEKRSQEHRKVVNKKSLWWLGGGILALLITGFSFLYMRGFLRREPKYKITNVPNLEDNRFPLLVVSSSNALTASGRLAGFWMGADAIYGV
ncbi:MAG: hypothetical protein KME64_37780 [Scytonematopsis contorta HA4267-MV1]|jgi:cardiolipin synthase|nr:hypothetical protein [Scytonematopsis contorta HA4267-MV1]